MRISEDYIIRGHLGGPVDVPDSDLWTFIKSGLRKNPEATAIIDAATNKSLTFREFQTKTENLAANLQDLGFNPKYPLTVYMPNCTEYALLCAACWALGGTVACINSALGPAEIGKTLNIIGCDFMCCHDATAQIAIDAARNTTVKKMLIHGEHPDCTSISSLLVYHKARLLPDLRGKVNPKQSISMLLFSSGTTGLPKAVEITHHGLIGNMCIFNYPGMDFLPACGIVYQPFSHIYGIALVFGLLAFTKKTIIMSTFDLEKYIRLVEHHQSTSLFFVPPLAVLFSKSNLAEKYDLSHVKYIICGAAPLGKSTEDEMTRMLKGRTQVRQMYGLTETGLSTIQPSQHLFPGESCPSGSVGLPSPMCAVKISDMSTGKALPPGQEGEVWLKSDFLMKGYRENRKATEDMIDRDGWLHSGDIGYCDGNGYLFVVDRLKELIKYKAFQVAPAELEALLLTHPEVADSGVIGLPDEECGELPHAWVVRKPNMAVTERQIIDFVNNNVAHYKKLRGGVKFVDAIPKSPSGKILRREIKRLSVVKSKL